MSDLFAKNIKIMRILHDKRQSDVGMAINLDPKRLSKIEKNVYTPTPEEILQLATYYNVSVDDLMQEDLQKKILKHITKKT